jgi:protein tyrosine phosphatase (PTP) superfamily phosphohydrolase (DUF442 family)
MRVTIAAPYDAGMATTVATSVQRLKQCVEPYPSSQQSMKKIEQACGGLEQGDSVELKRDIREQLWELRQAIPENAPRDVRAQYEKLRNLALDNSAERLAKGGKQTAIRPEPSAIPNFQKINDTFLRGGQPDQDGVNWLFENGVNTVVDLRGDDRDNQWAPPRWNPMKTFEIDIADFGTPKFDAVEDFIQKVDDPKNQPVFVHCKAGVGRTGLMTACWNVAHGMSSEEALSEERINSYHGSLDQEEFVREFEEHWKTSR